MSCHHNLLMSLLLLLLLLLLLKHTRKIIKSEKKNLKLRTYTPFEETRSTRLKIALTMFEISGT